MQTMTFVCYRCRLERAIDEGLRNYGYCRVCLNDRRREWRRKMPKILDEAVKQIKAKGASTSSAYAMATSALQKSGSLKPGTQKATPKGAARGSMSQAQRRSTKP
jgi:hypothetical protein